MCFTPKPFDVPTVRMENLGQFISARLREGPYDHLFPPRRLPPALHKTTVSLPSPFFSTTKEKEDIERKRRQERLEKNKRNYDDGKFIVYHRYNMETRKVEFVRYNPYKGESEIYDK